MRTFKLFSRRVALSVSCFAFIVFCSGMLRAQGFSVLSSQSNCFTISDPSSNSGQCNNTTCPADGSKCDICFDITFYGCDNSEDPDSFQITSNNCFNVCSHDGTFTQGSYSAPCSTANKQMVWNGSAGYSIDLTHGGTFTICGSVAIQDYALSLIHHSGPVCANPCTTVYIESDN